MSAVSRLRLWQSAASRLDLDFASAVPHYLPRGELLTDRDGLLHRIATPGWRYPVRLTLAFPVQELTRAAVDPLPLAALNWLERMFRGQAQLIVYSDSATLDTAGRPLSRRLAWRGVLDSLPEPGRGSLASLRLGGAAAAAELAECELTVCEDGSFSDFDSLGSYLAFDPPR